MPKNEQTLQLANSADYLLQVRQQLATLNLKNASSFNQARKEVFNSISLGKLISKNVKTSVIALSSGTSQALAFPAYIDQVIMDLKLNKYYRDYAPTVGSFEARSALALAESQRLKNSFYEPEEICITEGSTGAISAVMETLVRDDPSAEVLIVTPAYYIYKLVAQYFDMPYQEFNALPIKLENQKSRFLDLSKVITARTKLIIICNPTNPGGEILGIEEIKDILKAAKANNSLVMADELFADLVFKPSQYVNFDTVAEKLGALTNLVTIKGFSKSKNLAGLRIGYLCTKNRTLISKLTKTLEQRQCFPVASIFTGLIGLDAFCQTVQERSRSKKKRLNQVIADTKKDLNLLDSVASRTAEELKKLFKDYLIYNNSQLFFYSRLYKESLQILKPYISIASETEAAFNTFIKIDALQSVNQFDFMLNLYVQTGVKIEIGPCFGWNQKTWQTPDFGFWLRLSFSQEEQEYLRGIRQLTEFIPYYIQSQNQQIKTNCSF